MLESIKLIVGNGLRLSIAVVTEPLSHNIEFRDYEAK